MMFPLMLPERLATVLIELIQDWIQASLPAYHVTLSIPLTSISVALWALIWLLPASLALSPILLPFPPIFLSHPQWLSFCLSTIPSTWLWASSLLAPCLDLHHVGQIQIRSTSASTAQSFCQISVSAELMLPDLAKENTGCSIKFEFQINNG